MVHSISEIVRQLGFVRSIVSRVYQEYICGGQKTGDRENCEGELASSNYQKLNDDASRIDSKQDVQRSLYSMGFGSRQPTRLSLLKARHRVARLAWARKYRDWIVDDWKRITWSDEIDSDYFTQMGG
ncbi:HTH_Tnp_Tc3_2 domain-containing protein [Trichonephila clavipes]|uniref:HTH_Tnp_Tc3_2 domain-containing protein n=1 Tax=Trichonephila clavipes TaxID=2585209 RepID=A0A8X6SWU7_TRICX|nr:HTH_Tnp_Tc3_2 domain-containing protein [Trichonephila clavipes]